MKKPKRRLILCKVKLDYRTLIIYTNGEWRTSEGGEYHEWVLANSCIGPLFLYRYAEEKDWQTDWNSDNKQEVRLAEEIAKALVDREMEQILKS